MTTGPWWPPFEGLDERRRWRIVLGALGVLLVTGVAMLVVWPDSPGDIIAFEKAGDGGAPEFLAAWTGWDGWRAALVIVLDLPFLVAYGFGGALLLDGLARWSTTLHAGWARILRWLAWLPLLAAFFDVLEDLALLVVITDRTETWPDLAHTMANVKFALVYAFYGSVVVALVSAGVARARR